MVLCGDGEAEQESASCCEHTPIAPKNEDTCTTCQRICSVEPSPFNLTSSDFSNSLITVAILPPNLVGYDFPSRLQFIKSSPVPEDTGPPDYLLHTSLLI